MYGVKETQEAVILGARIGNAVDAAMSDGEITLSDSRYVFGVVGAVKPALEGSKFIGKELSDLDEEERETLANTLADELDLTSDEAEELVEECFDLTLKVVTLSQKIRALRRPNEMAA